MQDSVKLDIKIIRAFSKGNNDINQAREFKVTNTNLVSQWRNGYQQEDE